MNVSDILFRVKTTFGDTAGVQITDANIINWINDAQRELSNKSQNLQVRATTDLIAGQMEYAKPPNCLNLRDVRISGQSLRGIVLQEADAQFPNWDNPATWAVGDPNYFWSYSEHIDIYPVPAATVTSGIVLYYTRTPVTVALTTDVPELDPLYHSLIVRYCMQQAYELDENYQGANYTQSLFAAEFADVQEKENQISDQFYETIFIREEDY